MTPPARRTADDATDQRHVDHLFADSQDAVDDFIFDDDVADVFDDIDGEIGPGDEPDPNRNESRPASGGHA